MKTKKKKQRNKSSKSRQGTCFKCQKKDPWAIFLYRSNIKMILWCCEFIYLFINIIFFPHTLDKSMTKYCALNNKCELGRNTLFQVYEELGHCVLNLMVSP